MKRIAVFCLLSLATWSAPLCAANPPDILTVAVFDFESKDEAVRDMGAKVSVLINATLSADPQLITVERAELAKILSEQELGLAGTVSADTAAKVGHLTGAKVLVTGRIFRADKDIVVVSKIIGTETSRVFGEIVQGKSGASITDLSSEMAKKISAVIASKGETLVAKALSREDRIEKIKKQLKAGPLPAVSVKVPERHFGGPTFDPAVDTELGLILVQSGFTLVDEKSKQKADYEITGEAFSEFGMRKGNLVSCKARVEIKVRQLSDGKIIAVDRQMSVSANLSEQIAGKTALQNAAAEVAERIVPMLLAK